MSYTVIALQFIAFLDLLAVGLLVPLVPNHVRQMGGNHISVGLLGSIYAGFQMGSGPLIGSLSDLKGHKMILIVTLLICSVAYTLMGLTTSITIILIIRAVLGLFKQTQMLTKTLVPDFENNKDKQSDIYGKMAAISGVGITLGPIIGGHIVEDHPENGFTFVGIIVGICFIINAGLVYCLPNLRRPRKRRSMNMPSESVIHFIVNSIKQSIFELCKVQWSKYWHIFLFKALISFAMGVYYSNYSLYLKSAYDLSPKYIGYIISFQGVIGSICSFFIGYINSFYCHDKNYSQRIFHVFLLLSVSLLGLIMSFNIYIYTLWLIPLALGNTVGRLITIEMILKQTDSNHRGTLIGASNSVRSFSGVVAPMVAGFISQFFGESYAMYASLFSTVLGVTISYRYMNKRQKLD